MGISGLDVLVRAAALDRRERAAVAFPYTTLFRSRRKWVAVAGHGDVEVTGVLGSAVVVDVSFDHPVVRGLVVVGDGAGLDVPGQDRAGAVGREAQRIGGSGIGVLDDPVAAAPRELEEGAALAAGELRGDRSAVGGQDQVGGADV